jgi:hypothetical protein
MYASGRCSKVLLCMWQLLAYDMCSSCQVMCVNGMTYDMCQQLSGDI